MDGREIEPRTVIWAVAEVSWQDQSGKPVHERATLEDTSRSGACIRVKAPVAIGSRLQIKWHREQFSAVARNCRRDGNDFLLGVRKESEKSKPRQLNPCVSAEPIRKAKLEQIKAREFQNASVAEPENVPSRRPPVSSVVDERKVMESKTLFPKLWRRPPVEDATAITPRPEAIVNKSSSNTPESASVHAPDMLSYEDIYRAAGILNPPSGYGIQKVVDMLNNERLRDLSKDIKRASVLMALDAAGTSIDEILQDATRRQHALDSYETGRREQLETFEARKAQENAQIEAELERIRAHYAERIQHHREQIQQEKDALRNWQMAMQHEVQRIAEVIDLCKKPAASAASASAGSPAAATGNRTVNEETSR